MITTEAEAKEKWCPLVRIAAGGPDVIGNVTVNRWDDNRLPPDSLCIGSACMAWRRSGPDLYAGEPIKDVPGYCGAFGRPQGAPV